jgi:uncharacterized protein YfiM (DUF2279 family)
VNFDFRFLNSAGKWESKGHRRGADRAAAIRAMRDAGVGLPAGAYMSRPRGRQKDWDLFSLDREGQVTEVDRSPSGASAL